MSSFWLLADICKAYKPFNFYPKDFQLPDEVLLFLNYINIPSSGWEEIRPSIYILERSTIHETSQVIAKFLVRFGSSSSTVYMIKIRELSKKEIDRSVLDTDRYLIGRAIFQFAIDTDYLECRCFKSLCTSSDFYLFHKNRIIDIPHNFMYYPFAVYRSIFEKSNVYLKHKQLKLNYLKKLSKSIILPSALMLLKNFYFRRLRYRHERLIHSFPFWISIFPTCIKAILIVLLRSRWENFLRDIESLCKYQLEIDFNNFRCLKRHKLFSIERLKEELGFYNNYIEIRSTGEKDRREFIKIISIIISIVLATIGLIINNSYSTP